MYASGQWQNSHRRWCRVRVSPWRWAALAKRRLPSQASFRNEVTQLVLIQQTGSKLLCCFPLVLNIYCRLYPLETWFQNPVPVFGNCWASATDFSLSGVLGPPACWSARTVLTKPELKKIAVVQVEHMFTPPYEVKLLEAVTINSRAG